MRKYFIISAFCLLGFYSCTQKAASEKDLNTDFNSFKDGFVEELWKMFPGWASYVGYHNYDSVLTIPNAEFRQKQIEFCERFLDSLSNYPAEKLSASNRTDYYLIENELKSMIWRTKELKEWEWQPSEYNVGGSFGRMLNENYAPLDERLRNMSKKLDNVSAYYEAAKANITLPTAEHTELAVRQNKGAAGVFGPALIDSLDASGLSETEKHDMQTKIELAKMAIEDYVKWLEADLTARIEKEGARSFRIGKDMFSKKFEYDIVSSYTAEEVYQKALNHKEDLHNEMHKLTTELWPKYFGKKKMPEDRLVAIKEMIDHLSLQHVHRDSFQTAIEKQIPELEQFVREKNLLYMDPEKPLIVRKEPEYMAGVAGASVSSPGPYEKNGNTYYNVGSLANYSPEDAESYLREYNKYILQILNIHEAVPGHYAQLVYSNQSPSLIKSILGNGAMIEGWAVYTERMMLEEGYGNNEPEMWLMYYKWNMRATCNAIIDHEIHAGDMTEKQAMDLMINEAFQEKKEAANKWKRAKLSQVQLSSYFTGYTEIYEFREEMKARLGNDFDLKAFHEKFLSYGSAPVKYVRQLMREDLEKDNKTTAYK